MNHKASPADRAIGVAAKLFASPRGRIGTFGLDAADEETKEHLRYSTSNFAFVRFEGGTDSAADTYGHSYFREAPAVSSDVVLTLRDDLDPGAPGRPLISEGEGLKFWRIPEGYPASAPR